MLFIFASQPVKAAPFSSTFITFSWSQNTKFTLTDWQREFADMNKIGIKTLIVSAIATKGTMAGVDDNMLVYYDTDLYSSNRAPLLHLKTIMDLADQYKMNVYLTPFVLGNEYTSDAKKKEFLDVSQKMATEILAKYGQRPSFLGWYLPAEQLLNYPVPDTYVIDLAKYYKSITPTKKIIVAPYYIAPCTPGRFRCDGQWWPNQNPNQMAQNAKTYMQAVGADIMAVQDGTGGSEITLDELKSYLPPMAAAVTSIGKEFWIDVEMFKHNSDRTQYVSLDSTYLDQKIAIEKSYPLTMWIYNPNLSPQGGDASKQLYDYYYQNYVAAKSADFNTDGKVDLVDFSMWKSKYLSGQATLVDFTVWKAAYLSIVTKCSSDKECSSNQFCDYSQSGGLTPNGYIRGEITGSQQCIQKCQTNADCQSNQCQNYRNIIEDFGTDQKGCRP